MTVTLHTAAERPDLWERGIPSADVWPEYNLHGDVLNRLWGSARRGAARPTSSCCTTRPPTRSWPRGTPAPCGGTATTRPCPTASTTRSSRCSPGSGRASRSTRCAPSRPRHREEAGRAGWPSRSSGRCGRSRSGRGCTHLVAPVRPSWKERYPITPIEHYVTWRRDDGQLLDPWMRVHERLGARVATPLPRSMRITGTVAEWEEWTGLAFPQTGDYVFPEGLGARPRRP